MPIRRGCQFCDCRGRAVFIYFPAVNARAEAVDRIRVSIEVASETPVDVARGEFVEVRVMGAGDYDLIAELE